MRDAKLCIIPLHNTVIHVMYVIQSKATLILTLSTPHSHPSVKMAAVVITRMEENSSVSRTLCYLNRGDSFGELGIIGDQPRSATAISEGTVELLAFSEQVSIWLIQLMIILTVFV